jgi:hypothetical protein
VERVGLGVRGTFVSFVYEEVIKWDADMNDASYSKKTRKYHISHFGDATSLARGMNTVIIARTFPSGQSGITSATTIQNKQRRAMKRETGDTNETPLIRKLVKLHVLHLPFRYGTKKKMPECT